MRRFEFHDHSANSHKFWELHQRGSCYHTEYGRVSGYGRAGTRQRSIEKCDGKASNLLSQKQKKGYHAVPVALQEDVRRPEGLPVRATSSPPPTGAFGLINWTTL